MNFSRYYRNEGEFIYGFDPGIMIMRQGRKFLYAVKVIVPIMQRDVMLIFQKMLILI